MYRPRFNPGMQVRPTIASAPASVIFWLMSRWFLALKRMKPEEMAYLHGYRNLCRHFQRTSCVLGPPYLKRRLAQRNLANYTLYDTWNDPKDDTSLDMPHYIILLMTPRRGTSHCSIAAWTPDLTNLATQSHRRTRSDNLHHTLATTTSNMTPSIRIAQYSSSSFFFKATGTYTRKLFIQAAKDCPCIL